MRFTFCHGCPSARPNDMGTPWVWVLGGELPPLPLRAPSRRRGGRARACQRPAVGGERRHRGRLLPLAPPHRPPAAGRALAAAARAGAAGGAAGAAGVHRHGEASEWSGLTVGREGTRLHCLLCTAGRSLTTRCPHVQHADARKGRRQVSGMAALYTTLHRALASKSTPKTARSPPSNQPPPRRWCTASRAAPPF